MIENKVPRGVPNRPNKDSQSRLQGVLRRRVGKDVEKSMILRTAGTAKVRLSLESELDSHFGEGFPKRLQKGSQKVPGGLQETPRRPQEAPRRPPGRPQKGPGGPPAAARPPGGARAGEG